MRHWQFLVPRSAWNEMKPANARPAALSTSSALSHFSCIFFLRFFHSACFSPQKFRNHLIIHRFTGGRHETFMPAAVLPAPACRRDSAKSRHQPDFPDSRFGAHVGRHFVPQHDPRPIYRQHRRNRATQPDACRIAIHLRAGYSGRGGLDGAQHARICPVAAPTARRPSLHGHCQSCEHSARRNARARAVFLQISHAAADAGSQGARPRSGERK